MKTILSRFGSTLALGAAALCLALAPVVASAQSSTGSATATNSVTTRKGTFHNSDGKKGTFVTTITVSGLTRTTQTVYTFSTGGATVTDSTVATKNPDGSVTYQISDGSTTTATPYTANFQLFKIKGGQYGIGSFTEASGATGTIQKLVTRETTSTVRTYLSGPNAGKIDQAVDTEYVGFERIEYVRLFTDAAGKTTSSVSSHLITSIQQQ